MSFEPRDLIRHVLIEVDYLIERSDGLSLAEYRTDETLQRAFSAAFQPCGRSWPTF